MANRKISLCCIANDSSAGAHALSLCIPVTIPLYKVAVLVSLFNLLFCGALLQRQTTPETFSWVHRVSYLNYVYEILVVNELEGRLIVFNPKGSIGPGGLPVSCRLTHATRSFFENFDAIF